MTKQSKSVLGVILAMVLVFSAFGGTAWAVSDPPPEDVLGGTALNPYSPENPNNSVYVVEQPEFARSIDLTFVIEAGDSYNGDAPFRSEIPITLTSATGYYTVTDLLVAIAANQSNKLKFLDANYRPLSSSSSFLQEVDYDGGEWDSGYAGFDGWVFRVNDLFPMLPSPAYTGYYIGAGILDTYIKDGDIIHFFFDFPSQYDPSGANLAANYVRASDPTISAENNIAVHLEAHDTFIDPALKYQFQVNDYDDTPKPGIVSGITAKLYNINAPTVPIAAGVSNASGDVTFTGSFGSGKYIVKTESVLYTGGPALFTNVLFVYTGAYTVIELP
jgi:hypothetical protein